MADSYRTVLLEISEPEIKIVMRQSQLVLSLFRRLIDVTFCWFTGMCVKVENLWNLRNHESIGNQVLGSKSVLVTYLMALCLLGQIQEVSF